MVIEIVWRMSLPPHTYNCFCLSADLKERSNVQSFLGRKCELFMLERKNWGLSTLSYCSIWFTEEKCFWLGQQKHPAEAQKKINSLEGKFMQKQHKRMNCLCARNQYSHANEVPEVYEAVLCLNDSLWNNHVKVQL